VTNAYVTNQAKHMTLPKNVSGKTLTFTLMQFTISLGYNARRVLSSVL
jgi:hypothetical protein